MGRKWRSFEEARRFTRALGLKSVSEWYEYCSSGQRPDNIPSNPRHVYGARFEGYGDWLGTKREWRSFEEAREFARALGLKSQREWREYCKSGEKPDDIPSNPNKAYSSEYKGSGDWLGTGAVANFNREFRPFVEAREFVRQLGLQTTEQWFEYRTSGERPVDIPSNPNQTYASEFEGYGDWLGTGAIAPFNREFRPFVEAREFVRQLGLKSKDDWVSYCKSGKKPDDIPSDPGRVYAPEFKGYGDWLGTGVVANHKRQFRRFEEAREFVRSLGLKSRREWQEYCSSGEKPVDIPSFPVRTYASEFRGFGDWLGTGALGSVNREFRPFVEAREFARALGLKSVSEWREYCASGERPDDIPSNPSRTYGSKFKGYGDWLGTGTKRPRDRRYRTFEEAREFVRNLGLKSRYDWTAYCKLGEKPDDIPSSPHAVYAPDFKGYGDWLGIINKWTKHALLALLADLRPQLPYLEESELYTILQQGGSLPALRVVLKEKGSSLGQTLRELKVNDGSGVEQAIRGTSDDEIPARLDDASADESVANESDPEMLQANRIFERDGEGMVGPYVDSLTPNDTDNRLLTLATAESLRVIDSLTKLSHGLDDEAAEYLVANRVSALWEVYINDGRGRVDQLLSGDGGPWFTVIKRRFLSEVGGVENLVVPEGWSFATNGKPALPNAMQLRAAWTVREKRHVGNWSGTGSGKTLSAVLASRVIGARLTLVVTNNATVEGWKAQISAAYPDSVVLTGVDEGIAVDHNEHNYVVLNYEKFQGVGRNHLVHRLLDLGVDFVVFDEVQFVKQRDRNATNRRKALEALLSGLAENTPALAVMGMSATPVINNLLEAKKLLEIVVGVQFPELDTQATVNNALAVHRALMVHGFRYRPPYEQEMRTDVVTTTRNDLLEPLRNLGRDVLGVEQVLLPAKLEAVKDRFRKGTVVYTHYVDGMVAPIRRYLEGMGLTVGLYTGGDKSGLEPFLKGKVDVLVGSRPVGTGLDGLQYVCDRLVMLCLPWTSAEYEQIVGRIRRQGSSFGEVEIVVPEVVLDHEGDAWSWDRGRMALIRYKRTLSDCAVDGYIPETVRINPDDLLKRSREALERWIERIGEEGILAIEREQLTVPLPPDIREKVQVRHGDFTTLNNKWGVSRSSTTHERLRQDPSEWYLYHTLYREARESWPEQPFEVIADRIRVRPDWVVGDFGCGECLLSKALPDNRVIGLDHVGWDESVIECDMSDTPLDDASLDVAVFSLSLMGSNWGDYLKEAYRTVKAYGHLMIAEPAGKWQDRIDRLTDAIEDADFRLVGGVEQRYGFVYLTAVRA